MGSALDPHGDTDELPVVKEIPPPPVANATPRGRHASSAAPESPLDWMRHRVAELRAHTSAGQGARHAAGPGVRTPRQRAVRIAAEVGIVLGVALLASVVVRMLIAQPMYVPSAAMQATLQPGERILVTHGLASIAGPSRGDVIAFDQPAEWRRSTPGSPAGSGVLAFVGLAPAAGGDAGVLRVIGIGGDRVACCSPGGRIMLNGAPLDEPYLSPDSATDQVTFDVVVPPDAIFVMGDNRSQAADSRYHLDVHGGAVPASDVIGRVFALAWPPRPLSP